MGESFSEYGRQLSANWDRFWFTPCDTRLVCLLRILVGASATAYLLSFTGHLSMWLGPDGLLPLETVQRLTGADQELVFHWSYLNGIRDLTTLRVVHALGILILVSYSVGWMTRITNVLAFIVVLSYVHRVPMLTGPWEPVLTMLLLYLCFSPSGDTWSIDAWRRNRQAEGSANPSTSVSANVALRLIQLHTAGFYLTMGLTKLAGDTWWVGDAMWWLIAKSESRLIDLTGLHDSMMLINLLTHSIVAFELACGTLLWTKLGRPPLLLLAMIVWPLLAGVTGLVGFALVMLIATASFLPADLAFSRPTLAN